LVAGCTRKPQENGVGNDSSALRVSSESRVLSSADKLHIGPETAGAHRPQDDVVFSLNGRGVAYIADNSSNQFVVHNDKAGTLFGEISHLKISPDGRRVSYASKLGDYLLMVSDGVVSKPYKDVYDPVYSPDSRHVAFLAEDMDGTMYIVLDGKPVDYYVNVASADFKFSHDSGMLIYHVRPENNEKAYLVMYNLKTGTKSVKICLDTTLAINGAKDHLAAVVQENGMQAVADFSIASPEKVHMSATYDLIKFISLSRDGNSVAFIAGKNGKIYLVINGREYLLPGNLAIAGAPILRDDGAAATVVLESLNGKAPSSDLLYQTGQRFDDSKRFGGIREVVYSTAGTLAFVAKDGDRYFTVINGKPGPEFDAVVAPMFSPDGRKLVYRAREGAKRLVVIANTDGTEHRRMPSYEMVFTTSFTDDGKSVAYGVKEGNKLVWKVEKL
jgi:Tol biopolymer transport system component